MMRLYWLILLVVSSSISCQKEESENLPIDEFYAGGTTTVFKDGPDAFTFPLENLSQDLISRHFIADANFGAQFVTSPSPQQDGLGPQFNHTSCEGCHIRNGKGAIPQYPGDLNTGLLLRLSVPGAGNHGQPLIVPGYGSQLQTKAIFGEIPEGTLTQVWQEKIIEFLDGHTTTIRKPEFSISSPYLPLPSDLLTSPRNAPAVYGLGLLEAIPDQEILRNSDENDLDGDGISGKANVVWSIEHQSHLLGRFGWKAANPTALQQTADAFNHDMGITNPMFPSENCNEQTNCVMGATGEVDIDSEFLATTNFYAQTLAVPAARNLNNPEVLRGKNLFSEAKCSKCHIPKFKTGAHEISELSYQTIYPYTDLLLHDMGEDLADHRTDFLANGQEWRTPPLWGIGLTQVVNPKATFLHDGRAASLEEAVLWHGGEAKISRDFYLRLNAEDRQALIAFLSSL